MQSNRILCYLLALWKPARLHHQMKTMYLTVEVHCHNNPDPTSCTFRAEGWPTLKFPCPGLSSFLQVIPTSHMKTLWSATRRSCSSWLNLASNYSDLKPLNGTRSRCSLPQQCVSHFVQRSLMQVCVCVRATVSNKHLDRRCGHRQHVTTSSHEFYLSFGSD